MDDMGQRAPHTPSDGLLWLTQQRYNLKALPHMTRIKASLRCNAYIKTWQRGISHTVSLFRTAFEPIAALRKSISAYQAVMCMTLQYTTWLSRCQRHPWPARGRTLAVVPKPPAAPFHQVVPMVYPEPHWWQQHQVDAHESIQEPQDQKQHMRQPLGAHSLLVGMLLLVGMGLALSPAAAVALELRAEPARALSLPTWAVHVSSGEKHGLHGGWEAVGPRQGRGTHLPAGHTAVHWYETLAQSPLMRKSFSGQLCSALSSPALASYACNQTLMHTSARLHRPQVPSLYPLLHRRSGRVAPRHRPVLALCRGVREPQVEGHVMGNAACPGVSHVCLHMVSMWVTCMRWAWCQCHGAHMIGLTDG